MSKRTLDPVSSWDFLLPYGQTLEKKLRYSYERNLCMSTIVDITFFLHAVKK